MKELFVPYEIAILLKEKGFYNEHSWGAFYSPYNINDVIIENEPKIQRFSLDSESLKNQVYHNQMKYYFDCYSPLYQQAITWLKERHKIYIYEVPYPYEDRTEYHITFNDNGWTDVDVKDINEAIKQALSTIKQ